MKPEKKLFCPLSGSVQFKVICLGPGKMLNKHNVVTMLGADG